MINDFEKLKNIDYTKFKNERVSSNLKELIDKTNNAIIGKIYDLQSKNLLSSINNISENNILINLIIKILQMQIIIIRVDQRKEQKLNKLSIIMDKN